MVQGKLTEADTETIRLGATPSGLTSAHIDHPPHLSVALVAFSALTLLAGWQEGHPTGKKQVAQL